MQLRVADELDAMLASGQIADPARVDEALANILLLEERQLAGLTMDMIANAGPDVGPPLVPETTWGLPDDVGGFHGRILLSSTIPLSSVVEPEGTVVSFVGAEGSNWAETDTCQCRSIRSPDSALSASTWAVPARAFVSWPTSSPATYFSGINHPDLSFLPPQIPFVPTQTSKVAGYIRSPYPEESFIAAYGAFGCNLSVRTLKARISSKYSWQKSQPWYKRARKKGTLPAWVDRPERRQRHSDDLANPAVVWSGAEGMAPNRWREGTLPVSGMACPAGTPGPGRQ